MAVGRVATAGGDGAFSFAGGVLAADVGGADVVGGAAAAACGPGGGIPGTQRPVAES